jgi:hypothetical protein
MADGGDEQHVKEARESEEDGRNPRTPSSSSHRRRTASRKARTGNGSVHDPHRCPPRNRSARPRRPPQRAPSYTRSGCRLRHSVPAWTRAPAARQVPGAVRLGGMFAPSAEVVIEHECGARGHFFHRHPLRPFRPPTPRLGAVGPSASVRRVALRRRQGTPAAAVTFGAAAQATVDRTGSAFTSRAALYLGSRGARGAVRSRSGLRLHDLVVSLT